MQPTDSRNNKLKPVIIITLKIKIKLFDILIILIAAVVTGFSIYTAYIKQSGNPQVFLQGHEGHWIYQIDAEETVAIKGPLGNTIVRISGKCAWVESSPCDNQNCVASGKISMSGQWAACLPNNVILVINNSGNNNVDSIAW